MADNETREQLAKVLRIGVVQDGKVIHEQLIKPGQSVTLGDSASNTIVLDAEGIPKRFSLFEARGDSYFMNLAGPMSGKVAIGSEVASLEDLKARPGVAEKHGVISVPIDPNFRGKIMVGDITVLFQFVAAPPEPAKVISSKDFRPVFFEPDDYPFMVSMSLFSALGILLGIYYWQTPIPDLSGPTEIPDRFVQVMVQPKEEKPEIEEPLEDLTTEKTEPTEAKAEKAPEKKLPTAKNETEARQNRALEEQQTRQAATQRSAFLMMLGTTGENNNGTAVADLFADGDVKGGSLEDALQGTGTLSAGTASDMASYRGGPAGDGTRTDASVGGVGAGSGGGDAAKVGSAGQSAPRRASSQVGSIPVSGESGDEIRSVVKSKSGAIKTCYEAELKKNPELAGRVAVDLSIVGGKVTMAKVSENSMNNADLAKCIETKVRGWRFSEGVEEDLTIPFTFSSSN